MLVVIIHRYNLLKEAKSLNVAYNSNEHERARPDLSRYIHSKANDIKNVYPYC
jgi:hypothetical protein